MNKALINTETNICENVIVYGADWTPPDGYIVADLIEGAGIGWTYYNGQWIEPEEES
jgi:hypothetical protein